jgi:predicted NodU family carbamoyl transferase
MNILGLSAYHHDSAACLLSDCEGVAAAQEQRFTRRKHDSAFPSNAAQYCLRAARLKPADIDYVIFDNKDVRGEQIAFAPEDALLCFMGTELELFGSRQFHLAQRISEQIDKQGLQKCL